MLISPANLVCSYNSLKTSFGASVPIFNKLWSFKYFLMSIIFFFFNSACAFFTFFRVSLFLIKIETFFSFLPKLNLIVLIFFCLNIFGSFLYFFLSSCNFNFRSIIPLLQFLSSILLNDSKFSIFCELLLLTMSLSVYEFESLHVSRDRGNSILIGGPSLTDCFLLVGLLL